MALKQVTMNYAQSLLDDLVTTDCIIIPALRDKSLEEFLQSYKDEYSTIDLIFLAEIDNNQSLYLLFKQGLPNDNLIII